MPPKIAEEIVHILKDNEIGPISLGDLPLARLAVNQTFELNKNEMIYPLALLMLQKHKNTIREEIGKLNESGIQTLISSASPFAVVIKTKRDCKPWFCIDNIAFEQHMKAVLWRI